MSMIQRTGSNYNEANFKWFDYFDVQMIKKVVDRNAAAQYAAYGQIDEALREGIDVLDRKGREVKNNDQIGDYIDLLNHQIIKGCGNEAAFAANNFVLEKEGTDDLHLYNVNELTPAYRVKFDERGKQIGLDFDLYVGDNKPKEFRLSGSKMDTVYLCILRPSIENIRLGESKLMPIWDNLMALGAVSNNSTAYVIRVGAGLKVAYIDINDFMDPTTFAKLEKGMKNMNAINSVFIWPTHPEGTAGRSEVDINTGGGQINFQEIFDINAATIALHLKVPLNKIKGLFIGETTGADITRNLYYESLQMIQQDYTPVYKWLIQTLVAKGFLDAVSEGFKVDFRYKYEVSESDAVIIEANRLQNALIYMNDFGLDPNEALEVSGLEKVSPFQSRDELVLSKQANFNQGLGLDQNQNSKE